MDEAGGAGEIEGEIAGGRLACGRILGQRPHDHLRDLGGHPGGRLGDGVEVVPQLREQRECGVEQWRPGEQFVQEHTERVQVGGRPQPAFEDLFRRHVLRRADDPTRGGRRPVEEFRDPEVGHLHQAGGVEQNVVRLDVAVQHALGMCTGQRLRDGQADRAGAFGRYACPPAGQSPPCQQLHHDEAEAVVLDVVVDPDHMWMIKTGEQARLRGEASGGVLLRRGQHLDRDITFQLAMPARQHMREPAGTQPGAQLVMG